MQNVKYATIHFSVKQRLGITLNQYVLLDIINHLSKNEGWCYCSKDYLAEQLDVSRQAIFVMINTLIEKGLLMRHDETKCLKTTPKWNIASYSDDNFTDSKESLLPVNQTCSRYEQSSYPPSEINTDSKESLLGIVKKVYSDSKESLPYNNSYKNKEIKEKNKNPAQKSAVDFIDSILEIFCKEYEKAREMEFVIIDRGKERKSIGTLLAQYKSKNPEKKSAETILDFTNLFANCMKVKDNFLYDNISPTWIRSYLNKYKAFINKKDFKNVHKSNYQKGLELTISDIERSGEAYCNS